MCYSHFGMQFLLIMGIGTIVAICVVANLPKLHSRRRWREDDDVSFKPKAVKPSWRGQLDEVYSTDDFDYLRKLGRHQDDPRCWPAPLPPPPTKRPAYETEYN
jgi:hypothetical protein